MRTEEERALLDTFAAHALSGYLSKNAYSEVEQEGFERHARLAYNYAEAMMAEREVRHQNSLGRNGN